MLAPPPTGVVVGDPGAADRAMQVLGTLTVKGKAPMTGYHRDEFGPAWTDDVDLPGGHNGCDTRNDILRRDLVELSIKPDSHGCTVLAGTLDDPYTGATIEFRRGPTSEAVQIDHVVSLGNAWATGIQYLSAVERVEIANDPINLQATDGPTNVKKGDGDAATWLPPNRSFRCTYVARQVTVKSKYRLWVTPAERTAIAAVLGGCGATQPLPPPVTTDRTASAPPAATGPVSPTATGPFVSTGLTGPQGCHPLTSAGNCYRPGQTCREADHGETGIDADAEPIQCVDRNGWRWVSI